MGSYRDDNGNWQDFEQGVMAALTSIQTALTGGGGGGGGASVTVVNFDGQTGVLDMKAGALFEAFKGGLVQIRLSLGAELETLNVLSYASYEDGYGYVFAYVNAETETPTLRGFVADTADDYPHIQAGEQQ